MLDADLAFFGDGCVEAGWVCDILDIRTVTIFKVK
jgi:hypothetical protein